MNVNFNNDNYDDDADHLVQSLAIGMDRMEAKDGIREKKTRI